VTFEVNYTELSSNYSVSNLTLGDYGMIAANPSVDLLNVMAFTTNYTIFGTNAAMNTFGFLNQSGSGSIGRVKLTRILATVSFVLKESSTLSTGSSLDIETAAYQ
jgi:hypothetical protein